MSDDWGRKLSRFGNDLAAGLKDTGKLLKSDIDKARGYVAEQGPQSEAQRQAEQQHRWERANSPTWVAPAQAADTLEWATYELTDPRSQQVAVTFRHPADWNAGGQVMWPAGPGLPVKYAIGTSPASRQRSCHSASHRKPATTRSSAASGAAPAPQGIARTSARRRNENGILIGG